MSTPCNDEFVRIVRPVLERLDTARLDEISHHMTSRLMHSMNVAYLSYIVAKRLGYDYTKVVRGALLHDYFVESGKSSFILLIRHPRLALKNAKRQFNLSNVEEDIIVRHMFPLTLVPPKYKESWVVCVVDTYCAILEYTSLGSVPNFEGLI